MIECTYCSTMTKNAKFCSRSCSTSYNNSIKPKKAFKGICKSCDTLIRSGYTYCTECWSSRPALLDKTLLDVKYDNHHKSSGWALVRSKARDIMKKSREYLCANCGYSKHCEVAHIRGISDFPEDTILSIVNDLDNLIYLCPNCHWEFDNDILELDSIYKKDVVVGSIPTGSAI